MGSRVAVVAGSLLAGRYRVAERLPGGGMGIVWRAQDDLRGRPVAAKEILIPPAPDDEQERLRHLTMQEARAAAWVRHPAIVGTYDVFEQDGRVWIVSEWVPSRSLEEILQSLGAVSARDAALIGLSVLDGIEALHAAELGHGDVSPANVLLADDGRVMLTDANITTPVGTADPTGGGPSVASPDFVSPEHVRGTDAGIESDLWSLGATLYAAVEGSPPFHRAGPVPTLMAVVSDEPPRPQRAGALGPVLDGLLVKDPADRATPAEVRRLLEQAVQDLPERERVVADAGTAGHVSPPANGIPVPLPAEVAPLRPRQSAPLLPVQDSAYGDRSDTAHGAPTPEAHAGEAATAEAAAGEAPGTQPHAAEAHAGEAPGGEAPAGQTHAADAPTAKAGSYESRPAHGNAAEEEGEPERPSFAAEIHDPELIAALAAFDAALPKIAIEPAPGGSDEIAATGDATAAVDERPAAPSEEQGQIAASAPAASPAPSRAEARTQAESSSAPPVRQAQPAPVGEAPGQQTLAQMLAPRAPAERAAAGTELAAGQSPKQEEPEAAGVVPGEDSSPPAISAPPDAALQASGSGRAEPQAPPQPPSAAAPAVPQGRRAPGEDEAGPRPPVAHGLTQATPSAGATAVEAVEAEPGRAKAAEPAAKAAQAGRAAQAGKSAQEANWAESSTPAADRAREAEGAYAAPTPGWMSDAGPPRSRPVVDATSVGASRRPSLLAVALLVLAAAAALLIPFLVGRDEPAQNFGATASPVVPSPPQPTDRADSTSSPEPAATPPPGYTLHRDPTGFSIAIPAGWTVRRDGSLVDFREPGSTRFLRVDQTPNPRTDPYEDWLARSDTLASQLTGYELKRISSVRYRGWPTADWEYVWSPPGQGRQHVVIRNVVCSPARGYALYFSAADRTWAADRQVFDVFTRTFSPAAK